MRTSRGGDHSEMRKIFDKGDIFLIVFISIEMVWAAFMVYRPTLAAEPEKETGIVITKDSEPVLKLDEPKGEQILNISVNVSEAIKPEFTLDYGDRELMARLVNAEAKGEDMIGKRLIADVILNRLEAESFPDTISGVIYDDGQFATPAAGFESDDMEAVELELYKRLDKDVIYFRTGRFHNIGTRLYQHGGHYFSGKGE